MVGLLGPARGPARLRSAPRARGAAAGDLPGARPAPRRFTSRASWARLRSPVPSPRPPCRWPSSLRSASARRRRRGLTRRAARAPSLRSSGPVGPARIPRSLSSIYASLYVRAGRSGPPPRPPTLDCDHLRGGRALSLGHFPPQWGGKWSALGKRRAGPALKGGGAGLGPVLSLSRMRSWCGTPIPIVIRPSWGKQVSSDKASPPTHCVILSLATVVAPTALSPVNHVRT